MDTVKKYIALQRGEKKVTRQIKTSGSDDHLQFVAISHLIPSPGCRVSKRGRKTSFMTDFDNVRRDTTTTRKYWGAVVCFTNNMQVKRTAFCYSYTKYHYNGLKLQPWLLTSENDTEQLLILWWRFHLNVISHNLASAISSQLRCRWNQQEYLFVLSTSTSLDCITDCNHKFIISLAKCNSITYKLKWNNKKDVGLVARGNEKVCVTCPCRSWAVCCCDSSPRNLGLTTSNLPNCVHATGLNLGAPLLLSPQKPWGQNSTQSDTA